MVTKPGFAPMPEVVSRLAGELTSHEPRKEEYRAAPLFKEKPPSEKMSVNMPKDLYEELRAYMKLSDVPMSDVIVEGARRELARRKGTS